MPPPTWPPAVSATSELALLPPSTLPMFDDMGLPGIDWTVELLGSDVFGLDRGADDNSAAWLQSASKSMGGF